MKRGSDTFTANMKPVSKYLPVERQSQIIKHNNGLLSIDYASALVIQHHPSYYVQASILPFHKKPK